MTAKIKAKLLFRVLGVVVFFSSCTTSYHTITIETARPSQALLPKTITSLTLMNRSLSDEFRNFDRDSLQQYFYAQNYNVSSVILDSVAADTTLKVLGDLLFESGRYDVVIPEERNFTRDLKFFKVPDELDWNDVARICEEFQTDALLVMERYFNKLTTRYSMHPAEGFVSGSIDSKYDAVVKIYDPVKQEVVRQIVVSDTISWNDLGSSPENLFTKLPPVKECLIQTGIQVALELDNRLSPVWVSDKRGYFVIKKDDIEKISRWIGQNDWQAAFDYWLTFADSENPAVKSKAQHNLALASEMLGKVDEAIAWANRSYRSKYYGQTERYLYKLGARKETLKQFRKLEEK
ncbi:MAG: DUF6340 family protein [Prolixibacteraceae bacterium]